MIVDVLHALVLLASDRLVVRGGAVARRVGRLRVGKAPRHHVALLDRTVPEVDVLQVLGIHHVRILRASKHELEHAEEREEATESGRRGPQEFRYQVEDVRQMVRGVERRRRRS